MENSTAGALNSDEQGDDCCVCFEQPCVPVTLPCRHTFCFLCIIKGVASDPSNKDVLCPHCRHPIPASCISKATTDKIPSTDDLYAPFWYYQGSKGWWRYDPRTEQELEKAYWDEKKPIELRIGRYTYIFDFREIVRHDKSDFFVLSSMVQYRADDPKKKRRLVKRWVRSDDHIFVQGIAGMSWKGAKDGNKGKDQDDMP